MIYINHEYFSASRQTLLILCFALYSRIVRGYNKRLSISLSKFMHYFSVVNAHTKLGLTATLVREDDKIQVFLYVFYHFFMHLKNR